jgi:hypothetical protein
MAELIPENTSRFLTAYIDSIAELEALLLLHAQRERLWTQREMAERLYIGEPEAGAVLRKLMTRGFVTQLQGEPARYRYQPDETLGRSVDQVAEAYRAYLIPVTKLVHGKARRALQGFADAFKLKQED